MGIHFYIPKEKPLNDTVHFFWQVKRSNTQYNKENILPKGGVEIVFNFFPETIFKGCLYNTTFTIPKCFVQAYHTQQIELSLPKNQFLFGIVIYPTALKSILKVPAGNFAKQCIDLTLVDASFNTLWYQLVEKNTFEEKVALFSSWLIKRLSPLTQREETMNRILTSKNEMSLSVVSLSNCLCYSSRQLSRIFYELTGMNIEQTLLYLKYLKAVNLIHNSSLSLTQIAYTCGFSDQSHFIKVFKLFTSLCPNDYKSKKSTIVGHYFDFVR